MSGFMRQLKQNNEQSFKSRFKQPIKYNQGSAVSLYSAINKVNPQRCHGNTRQVINSPNYPRSINKLDARSCDRTCDTSLTHYKRNNLSNRNLIDNRISARSHKISNNDDLCCKKNILKQYQGNGDLIDQIKSDNLKRNTLIKPINKCSSDDNGCGYSHYSRSEILKQCKNNLKEGRSVDCNECNNNRTVYESMNQYKRCNTVKNINTLDSSEYIRLYRSCLVSDNNKPTQKVDGDRCDNVTNCVNNCN